MTVYGEISKMKKMAEIVMLSLLTIGPALAQAPAWVDQAKVRGHLAKTEQMRPGDGIAWWATYMDPDGDVVTLSFELPIRATVRPPTEPNEFTIEWRSLPTDLGVFYFYVHATDPEGATDDATFAVNVTELPVNNPPAITNGGCKVFPR